MLRLPTRHAFTLIELMISITLGMLLVYTALAGFRVAAQCNTLSNRLSIENSFIRAGFIEAHNQLDFWTQLDDPEDATKQGLRGTVAMGTDGVGWHLSRVSMPNTVGLPFTPMSLVFPPNKRLRDGTPLGESRVPRFAPADGKGPTIPNAPYLPLDGSAPAPSIWPATGDEDCGFDPSYAWSPHDPRTWYRGNCIEKYRRTDSPSPNVPSLWFGRYALFMNSEGTEAGSTLAYTSFDGVRPDYRIPAASPPTDDYQASYTPLSNLPPHRWYTRQLLGLSRALGFYGMCDYLPSNVLYGVYVPPGADISRGGLATYFQPDRGFFIGSGMERVPTLGLYALTVTQSYGVVDPTAVTAGKPLAEALYSFYNSDYTASGGGGADRLQQFMKLMMPLKPWATTLPANWPQLAVGVARYIKSAKFVGIARIRWSDPLTGNTSELSFTGVGSSLRGARMQRKPTSGWAEWDNGPGATNDANLDTP
jgi:Prokaryotic N-terminal methylation motif